MKDPKQNGKFKVPTLRNIAVAPFYGPNGSFKTLKEIVLKSGQKAAKEAGRNR